MTRDLLPIGTFARLCRLSVKQLRHYDESGLLRPATVDPATGYRYYDRDQVRDAMAIALLRRLDVPLAAIGQVLVGDDGVRAEVLRAEQGRLEERIAAQRRSWQLLDRLLTGGLLADGLLQQEVSLSREPARRLLVRRAVCAPEEIGMAITRCVGELMGAVVAIRWTPPLYGLFPVDLGAHVAVAVGVESAEPTSADGTVGGTEIVYLPSGPAAAAVHVGPYEHLALTYQAVFAWIHERGLRPCGSVLEAYLTDPGTSDPAQLVTRIVVPVDDEELS
ncbi:MerR family transcriptional regulator [Plantactinospora soyae]|uniref:DNA-binding transcriptional MerR regulator n=1 Tax=Plantactinospora soyae TaxID=1544732 RepID=A0A927RAW2_9ACTN|nr:MerR family transcriptional regulator [Plantactinospora soyae]MBE1491086.1 DNA-binding transcriptional MerR regulator [Plantactinospora soyae]